MGSSASGFALARRDASAKPQAAAGITDDTMRIAHFIQRYPPALGGSEAYFARLSRYCAGRGDAVTVFTSDALALEAFWSPEAERVPAGVAFDGCVEVRRYPL